jgi:cyclopropane-fatty-acyl-phospholipid synthase
MLGGAKVSRWRMELVRKFLDDCGVRLDGDRPWDVRVLDDAFYTRALARGRKGILDAYVDGWWDTERLDELTCRVFRAAPSLRAASLPVQLLDGLYSLFVNRQSRRGSRRVRRHYDLGNDLFEAMLDRRLVYSCAYWRDADDLDRAQEAKLDLVCRKLALAPGMRLLDVGCGFGSLAAFAAERYSVSVVGVTLSAEQLKLGRERCAGLPVELRLQDYRDLPDERFDAVASLGMFEHVGYKNYATFFDVVRRRLAPHGLFLLHTIGGKLSQFTAEPWMTENIFPNSMLPSAKQIAAAAEGRLVIEDWHNFGIDYDRTLMAWYANFEAGWPSLQPVYGDRFYRLWKCFLLTCAGSFRARENQLWQVVFSPDGADGGYRSVR